jgi:predicted MFS family arabinose efflux permease
VSGSGSQNSQVLEPSAWATAVTGLTALAIAIGIGRFAFTPLLPLMEDDAGLSIAAGGWLASANYLGYLIGALTAVRLNISAEKMIRAGLALIVVTTLAMGVANDFSLWIVMRTLSGIASAWVLVFVSAWSLAKLAQWVRPGLSGVVFAGVGVGIAVAGGLVLVLMYAGTSSQLAWIVCGVLALVSSAVIWPMFRMEQTAAAVSSTPLRARFEWNGNSARLIFCYGAFGFGYIIPATFVPAMAKQIVPNPLVFGWSWPVFGAAAALSTLAAVALRGSGDNRRLWIASHLVMAAGVVLPVLWSDVAGILFAAILVGGTFMVTTMVAIEEGRRAGGVHAKKLIAAMTAAFAAGQIIGPIAASLTVSMTGDLSVALLVGGVVLIVGAAGLLNFGREQGPISSSAEEET